MNSSGSSIRSMPVMCEGCENLYTGDESCMLGVTQAERERRAAAGRCDDAVQLSKESGHTARVIGSMVLGSINKLWEFIRR